MTFLCLHLRAASNGVGAGARLANGRGGASIGGDGSEESAMGRRSSRSAASVLGLGGAVAAAMGGLCVANLGAATVTPAFAQAAPAPVDPLTAQFDALPEATRRQIQDSLVWMGDYQGVVDGAFGRRSREAFASFARRLRRDGAPDPETLKALFAAAEQARKAAGFVATQDATGVRIGVPKAVTPRATPTPTASRHASRDGRIALDVARVDGAEMDLPRLFERLTVESPTRRVTYRLSRPDFIVVAGETQGRKFYTRFASGADAQGRPELRGFTFYVPPDRPDLDRLTIAIANSFDPFPLAGGAGKPVADGKTAQGGDARPATAGETKPAQGGGTKPVTAPPRAPAATAMSLGGGRYLSSLASDCAAPKIGGAAAKVVARDASGLVLLDGPPRPAATVSPGSAAEGDALAFGFSAGDGGPVLTAVAGRLDAQGRFTGGLQPGMSGAPVFDRDGRFLGMARGLGAQTLVFGVAPSRPHGLTPAAAVGGFAPLAAASAPIAAPGALGTMLAGALAPLTCGS